ncbi:carbonic anhydrase [Pseudonocardia hydrocarbonoxydans]|uniref:carbonic anhydrase n=1 Tax=Pseudonocardia hydrocarbonoxydans TaxID=76726 RepID=UPI0031D4891B
MVNNDGRPVGPVAALEALLAGNRRFALGSPRHPNQDAVHRVRAAEGQNPFAVVVGCSDSRVAAEIVFDCGLGDLFVVRTAGHLLGAEGLASIEFAVAALHTPLVVVLGHDRCGAISAALDAHDHGRTPTGHLRVIAEQIVPEIRAAHARNITDRDAIGEQHVIATATRLLEQSPLLADRVDAGRLAIAGMTYALAQGRVRIVVSHDQSTRTSQRS